MGKISPLFDDRHRGKTRCFTTHRTMQTSGLQRRFSCGLWKIMKPTHTAGIFLTLPPPRSLRAHAALYCPHGKSGRCRPRDGRTFRRLFQPGVRLCLQLSRHSFSFRLESQYKRVDLNLQYPAGWEEAKEIKNLNRDLLPLRRAITSAQPLSKRRKAVPYTISQERTIFPSHSLIIPRER